MARYEDEDEELDIGELQAEIMQAMPLAKEEWRDGRLCYRGGASTENSLLWKTPAIERDGEPVIFVGGQFRELKANEYDLRATMLYVARKRGMVNKRGPQRCPKCGGFHDIGGQKILEKGGFRSGLSHAIRRLRKRGILIPVPIRNVKMREVRIVRIHRDYQPEGDGYYE